ncbi:MAG: hypothetical protein APR63_00255 [Desulfuromonas sp. SDB]|nr:MAG: hypothetical protein APR63_00255 [Desulfuromonas sp. SDB]
MNSIIVQKYGGTTVSSAQRIRMVAQEIAQTHQQGHRIVVVVSAMGDTTDQLIELAKSVSVFPDPREYDMLITVGERIAISLLSMALKDIGKSSISFTGSQAGIITDHHHTDARIIRITAPRVLQALQEDKIAIVAGCQGVSEGKEITTLGRSGSDTSAVALACALKAEYCDIYTDVDGVYAIDPRLFPHPRHLDKIDYSEMMEMAETGAKVVHPRAVEIASRYLLPIRVKSLFHKFEDLPKQENKFWQGGKQTLICSHPQSLEEVVVKGITVDYNRIFFKIEKPSTLSIINLLKEIAQKGIVVTHYHQSQSNSEFWWELLVDKKYSVSFKQELESRNLNYNMQENLAVVSIIGTGSGNSDQIMDKLYDCLGRLNIETNLITTSEVKISILIQASAVCDLINKLAEIFSLEEKVN